MIRFPGRTNKRRSNKLEVIAKLKVNTEIWVSENIESAMFKDTMLPLTENNRKLLHYLPC